VATTSDAQGIFKGNHEVVRRLTFQGMQIAIETDKNQLRHWSDKESGEAGSTKMRYPYGYFIGTKNRGQSGDAMALDVFVGPEEDVDEVYVVHQMKKPEFKEFDELKVMVGFESAKQAHMAYLSHYDNEKFLGSMDTLSLSKFKDKYLNSSVTKAMDAMPLSSAAIGTESIPNPAGIAPAITPTAPVTQMPAMQSSMDVETLEGVESLLRRTGSMKDNDLLRLIKEIWGPGYQYINAPLELVRCEITGFLLDQRDLLKTAKEQQAVASALMSPSLSPGSNAMSPLAGQFGGGTSSAVASQPTPSTTLSPMGF